MTALRQHSAGLRSRDISSRSVAERAIMGQLLDIIDSRSTCVVRADMVGFSMGTRYGHFGVDEPWPASLPLGVAPVDAEDPDQMALWPEG